MNKPYLIAVDLDGTLIANFDHYDKKSFEYLKELAKEHYVVIATGRPYRSSIFYYDLLQLKTPIVNYNGALVQNPHDRAFPKTMITIDRNIIRSLISDNEDILINVFCEIEDDIFLWRETQEIVPYLHISGGVLTVGNFDLILHKDPNGAIIIAKCGSEERLKAYLQNKYPNQVNIRFWYNEDLAIAEIYNPLTSKGNAIAEIAKYYSIPQQRIIAIGDAHNDLEMIQYAHIGVVMGEGHPDLVSVAKYHTLPLSENGVYHFLNEFFKKM
ncbi:MAG: HAD family hydrolase [Bacilli bacterium]|nr:HAD family hydrolase [Bacilli bacterium]